MENVLKTVVACLILILSCLSVHSPRTQQAYDIASTAPVDMKALTSYEGQYQLVNGTQGCPTSVIWFEQCAGFVLNPRAGTEELTTSKFCHLNRGDKMSVEGETQTSSRVELKDRYIKKTAKDIFHGVAVASSEDTLIFGDNNQQFLWEHTNVSEGKKGFSCLYSK